MNKEEIEELAFKDRKELANLNELDLLEIIEFLQNDRKQWINQFTQTHNESIDIQKENQELKKQVEEYKRLGFKHLNDKCNKLENQQKEFINWLIENESLDDYCNETTFTSVREKYEEIIGGKNER